MKPTQEGQARIAFISVVSLSRRGVDRTSAIGWFREKQ